MCMVLTVYVMFDAMLHNINKINTKLSLTQFLSSKVIIVNLNTDSLLFWTTGSCPSLRQLISSRRRKMILGIRVTSHFGGKKLCDARQGITLSTEAVSVTSNGDNLADDSTRAEHYTSPRRTTAQLTQRRSVEFFLCWWHQQSSGVTEIFPLNFIVICWECSVNLKSGKFVRMQVIWRYLCTIC